VNVLAANKAAFGPIVGLLKTPMLENGQTGENTAP